MIVIIGGGPAGLSAALAAANGADEVLLLDSAPRLGGQYWRHQSRVSGYKSTQAHELLSRIANNSRISVLHGATVWSAESIGDSYRINYVQEGLEKFILAKKLILATGAYDRSLPFPGWDSPGVMTAGAAQALLKGHGILVGKRVVVAGTGPFLLPVATGLAEAGATVVALLEANSPFRWALSPIALIGNVKKIPELLHYQSLLKKHSIKIEFGKTVVNFQSGRATIGTLDTDFEIKQSLNREVECDVVAIGWGFQPEVTIGGILGCQQKVDSDGSVIFEVDRNQRSSRANIWLAGEATGIGGADLALVEGEIAGLAASGISIPKRLRLMRMTRKRFARALMRSYPVKSGWVNWMQGDTIICRCEEVSVEEVATAIAELGADDSRGVKLFTRCGMGLCQGRVCSRQVADFVSSQIGTPVTDSERIAYSNRPIAYPISLGLLADGNNPS